MGIQDARQKKIGRQDGRPKKWGDGRRDTRRKQNREMRRKTKKMGRQDQEKKRGDKT